MKKASLRRTSAPAAAMLTIAASAATWLCACVPAGGTPASGASGLSCDGGPCLTSPPVNCVAAERGLEFAPFMVADFEASSQTIGITKAQFLYTYTDATAAVRYTAELPTAPLSGYEPPSVAEDRCTADPPQSNHVFHILGGPFLGWGGGMGIAMQHLYKERSQDRATGLCAGAPPLPDYCPAPAGLGRLDEAALDVSQWEGVALWARRGPNSQPLLRVLVGNKFTDDDVSFLSYQNDPSAPRYCERILDCSCPGSVSCDYYSSPQENPVGTGFASGFYCGAPGSRAVNGAAMGVNQSNTCNITRCDQDYSAYPGPNPNDPTAPHDPQFNHKACTPHAFRNGTQSSFCFNPGDAPPAEPNQQCGDHFTFPLHLTTEWQLYLVPFSSMSQQGWAKKAPYFDLKSVSVVRLTWDAGNIDYTIDNIRFYRARR